MYRVLIADDNPLVCDSLRRTIHWGALGFSEPATAADGDLAYVEMEAGDPDLVISDIRMPGMDGLKLLEESRKQRPGRGFIIITGFDEFDYARDALRLGADDLIVKPISNRELSASIERVVARFESAARAESKVRDLEQKYRQNEERVRCVAAELRVKLYRDILHGEIDGENLPEGSLSLFDFHNRRKTCFALALGPEEVRHTVGTDRIGMIGRRLESLYGLSIDFFVFADFLIAVAFARNHHYGKWLASLRSFFAGEGVMTSDFVFREFSSLAGFSRTYEALSASLHGGICDGGRDGLPGKSSSPDSSAGRHFSPHVTCMLRYLLNNITTPVALDDLAREAGLSGAHASRLLKKEVGHTFSDLQNRLRVGAAIEKLKEGNRRVYEVAIDLGFDNYAYFYQVFKKITGYSPKEFPYNDPHTLASATNLVRQNR